MHRLTYCALAALVLAASGCAFGQLPQVTVPSSLPPLRDVSVTEHRAHLDALRSLVADCGRVVTACDRDRVGSDDRVRPDGGPPYTVRYGWLRNLIDDRNDASHKLRDELLPQAEQRLSEDESELDHPAASLRLDANSRTARDILLANREFQTADDYSLSERIASWLSEKISKLFLGAASLGRMAPWLGAALEWGALLLVLALLATWVYRVLDRQRALLGKLSGDPARAAEAETESRTWIDLATAHGVQCEWRDAVHCMYWATVVLLEDRRTVRRSTTRTPRETLALLDSGASVVVPLRTQTSALERIWYGYEPASEADFDAAKEQHRQVRTLSGSASL